MFSVPSAKDILRVGHANLFIAIGDSLTFNLSFLNADARLYYPYLLGNALSASPYNAKMGWKNTGVGGITTAQMLTIAQALTRPVSPTYPGFAVIYGGRNDGAPYSGTAAAIVSIGQQLQSIGFAKLMVGIFHYLNYSAGGDTLVTQNSDAGDLRTQQHAAATTLGCEVADFYNFFRNKIVAGSVVQGDSSAWHVADSNEHLNAAGEQFLSDCIVASTTPSWLSDFRTV